MPKYSTNKTRSGKRFPIRAKIMLNFSIIFTLIFFLSLFNYYQLDQARKLTQDILPYSQQVKLLNKLSYSVDSLESQVDTFFVTPYIQYWSHADQDLQDMESIIDELSRMGHKEGSEQLIEMKVTLDELKKKISTIFSKIVEQSDKNIDRGHTTNYAISELYAQIRQAKDQYKEFLLENTDQLQAGYQQQQDVMEKLSTRIILISIFVLLLAIVFSLFIAESISKPIRSLKKSTDAFANGQKDIEVIINTNDEVGDLARSFNQMTNTLQKQQAHLDRSKKMEAIGLVAGGVAHDLNNVLTGVIGYPDLLLMKMSESDPNRKMVETIQESGRQAAVIVEDLLTLARRGVPSREIVDLNEIVSGYHHSPEHQKLLSSHPQQKFELALKADSANIIGSRVHLRKMLMNLIYNAVEANVSDGLVKVATKNQSLTEPLIGYSNIVAGSYVVISVEDSGHGIKKEDLNRIFEPFFTKKGMARSGTGLGMPIVLGTVEDHAGYITVESEVGRGTTICVYFPLTNQAISTDDMSATAKDLKGGKQKILVIDDLASQREVASQLLESLDYTIHCLSTGESAVAYLGAETADVVLLDMVMEGGIDGAETFRRIRKNDPDQKVVIVSGYESKNVKQLMALGAISFLKKPYRYEELAETLKQALQ